MNAQAVIAVSVIVLAVLAWYAIWPWGPCPACRGRRGRGPGSTPRAWNRCRRCGGSGERLRLISRLIRRDLARKENR